MTLVWAVPVLAAALATALVAAAARPLGDELTALVTDLRELRRVQASLASVRAAAADTEAVGAAFRGRHAPGEPPMEETGTATRKMVMDGRVLVEDLSSSMMGMPFKGQGMHGFDNVTGKHWSTWIDSMSTGVMLSEGTCDAQGACTFTGTYNDPVKKGPATLRMTSRWTSPTVEVFEMYGPGPDGKEIKMMEITYTKKG